MGEATLVVMVFRALTPIETFEFLSLSSENFPSSSDCVNTVLTVQVLCLQVLYSGYCRDSYLGALHQPWASRHLDCVCTGKVTCHLTVIVISWSYPHSTTVESNFTTKWTWDKWFPVAAIVIETWWNMISSLCAQIIMETIFNPLWLQN